MGLRLIDLGTCFNTTTLDTSQLSVEAQSLPYRAPEASIWPWIATLMILALLQTFYSPAPPCKQYALLPGGCIQLLGGCVQQ